MSLLTKIYQDFDLEGELDETGSIIKHRSQDALANAIKLWMISQAGGYLRNPSKGGYLESQLYGELSEDKAETIKDGILAGLSNDFSVDIVVSFLSVIPDYSTRSYEINLQGYSPQLKLTIEILENIKIRGL